MLFGADSLAGVGFDLLAGKDMLKDKATKAVANARLARMDGAWSFALATAEGYAAFSVTVKKGKGKLSGTLPDGTKVSVSSQGVLGDEALAIPFMYAKKGKGSLGLVFWVHDDGSVEVSDLTVVTLALGHELATELVAPSASLHLADGAHTFTTPTFTQTFQVAGKKWTFPKQQKNLGPADPNPNAVKLTFTEKTGVVKGTFTALDPVGKKLKYTVNGVVVDGVMYGSAMLKGSTSVSVTAE